MARRPVLMLVLLVLANLGVAAMRNGAAAVSPTDLVFVASRVQAEVVVVDSTSDHIVGRIPLPDVPGQLLAMDGGRRLAASDPAHRKLHLLDAAARRIERGLDLPIVPTLVQINHTNSLLAAGDPNAGTAVLAPVSGEDPRP